MQQLQNIYTPQQYKSMRASSYDRTGANNDSIMIPAGESHEIQLHGCGVIKHIWTTFLHANVQNYHALQLQIIFDGEVCVAMSVADFFALPTGNIHDVNSAPIQVSRTKNHPRKEIFEEKPYRGAMHCYWEMPFLQGCTIKLTNCDSVFYRWYYHIDWEQHDTLPADILYFRATKCSEQTQVEGVVEPHGATDFEEVHDQDSGNYVFLDIAGYQGHYVGLSLMIEASSSCHSSWWEGDEMFVLDGEAWPPRLHGTGLEDYFGLAYGFRVVDCRPQYGISYITKNPDDALQMGGVCCMYRFHLESPVVFTSAIKASLEHGHANKTDAFYSSVAYWYGRLISHQDD